ncbi:MAG: ATP-dependent DNA helicase, partial [Candidatus Dormiibacterota bacterium]
EQAWISTFHSFCGRLLRTYQPAAAGTLIDGFQEQVVMRETLLGMPSEELGELFRVRSSGIFAQDALAFVSLIKQNRIHQQELALLAAVSGGERVRALASVYQAYQARLDSAGLRDFRDLVSRAIGLLEARPPLLTQLRDQFRYVLVDEFQDVDPAQFHLLRTLAPPPEHPRLVVVGDPDQSIYAFRGTVPRLLRDEFATIYGGRAVELGESHRCPPEILDAGRRLLRSEDLASVGSPEFRGLGQGWEQPLQVVQAPDSVEEATLVARTVRRLLLERPELAPHDVAILLRSTTTLAAPFEEALAALGVPYQVRDLGTAQRNEVVRFLLAYLRALAEPDEEGRLERLLASGLTGVPRRALGRIRRFAEEEGRAFPSVVRRVNAWLHAVDPTSYPLPWPERAGATPPSTETTTPPDFAELLDDDERRALHAAISAFYRLRGRARRLSVHALAYAVLLEVGVMPRLLALPEGASRERSLADLRTAMEAFGDLQTVWEALHGAPPLLADVATQLGTWIASAADRDATAPAAAPPGGAVQLMTVHQAKGLEFEVVFLGGFARGVFPLAARPHPVLQEADQRWLEETLQGFRPSWPSDGAAHLAEEARLAYVGMTRAKRRLYLSFADEYDTLAGASPFLEHLRVLPALRAAAPGTADGAADAGSILTASEAELLLAGRDLDSSTWAQCIALGLDVAWLQEPAAGLPFLPYRDPPQSVDPGHFSPTSLNDYLRCPRLYYYNHHPGLTSPPRGFQLERGSFLHRVLEEFHKREAEWVGERAEVQREWLERTLEPLLQDYLDRVATILDRDREEREVRRMLGNYVAFVTGPQPMRRLRTLATEQRFFLPLDGSEVRGKIDRIIDSGDGRCEIIDYKTGRGSGIQKTFERYFGSDLFDVQLLMYEIACREAVDEEGRPLGFDPGVLSVWFPKDQVYGSMRQSLFPLEREAPGVNRRTQRAVHGEDIERGRSLAVQAIRRIRAGDFAPAPRPDVAGTCLSYVGCPHSAICPFGGSAPE